MIFKSIPCPLTIISDIKEITKQEKAAEKEYVALFNKDRINKATMVPMRIWPSLVHESHAELKMVKK